MVCLDLIPTLVFNIHPPLPVKLQNNYRHKVDFFVFAASRPVRWKKLLMHFPMPHCGPVIKANIQAGNLPGVKCARKLLLLVTKVHNNYICVYFVKAFHFLPILHNFLSVTLSLIFSLFSPFAPSLQKLYSIILYLSPSAPLTLFPASPLAFILPRLDYCKALPVCQNSWKLFISASIHPGRQRHGGREGRSEREWKRGKTVAVELWISEPSVVNLHHTLHWLLGNFLLVSWLSTKRPLEAEIRPKQLLSQNKCVDNLYHWLKRIPSNTWLKDLQH